MAAVEPAEPDRVARLPRRRPPPAALRWAAEPALAPTIVTTRSRSMGETTGTGQTRVAIACQSVAALEQVRTMLERRVDFGRFAVPGGDGDPRPLLLVGAVDVVSGEFKAFNSRRDPIGADTILASAAIPNLFRFIEKIDRLLEEGRLQAQPRPGLHPRPHRPWRGQGGGVPGRARLRAGLAGPRPRGGAGLLHRRRRADLGAAVPRPGKPPRPPADRPVRARAPDHRPAGRPDPQAGRPRPVTWTVRAHRDDPAARVSGRAEADLRGGRVVALRLGG